MKDRISPTLAPRNGAPRNGAPRNVAPRKLRISGPVSASRGASLDRLPKPILSRIGDAAVWRLPSGKPLAQFALEAGFLAPLLLAPDARLFAPDARRSEPPVKKVGQA